MTASLTRQTCERTGSLRKFEHLRQATIPAGFPKFRGFKITAQRPGSSRVIAALFSVEIGLSFAERRKFAEEPSTAPDMDAS
jgi:hypothetical protein